MRLRNSLGGRVASPVSTICRLARRMDKRPCALFVLQAPPTPKKMPTNFERSQTYCDGSLQALDCLPGVLPLLLHSMQLFTAAPVLLVFAVSGVLMRPPMLLLLCAQVGVIHSFCFSVQHSAWTSDIRSHFLASKHRCAYARTRHQYSYDKVTNI